MIAFLFQLEKFRNIRLKVNASNATVQNSTFSCFATGKLKLELKMKMDGKIELD